MRRRIRWEYTWSGGAWVTNAVILYVYDGNLVIEERNANNLPAVSYTRGRDLSGTLQGAGGIGGLLARSDLTTITPQHSYYHADGNGNITCLINTNQAVVAKYLYDPYGNILSQSGSLAGVNLYLFSSKEFHVNSGLVYYLYRSYDPSLQRWPNRDPLSEEGSFSLYEFACNAPIGFLDDNGLQVITQPTKPPVPTPPAPPVPKPKPPTPKPKPPVRSPLPKPPIKPKPFPILGPLCLYIGEIFDPPSFGPEPDYKCTLTSQDARACYYQCTSPVGPFPGVIIKPSPNWKCPDPVDLGQVKPPWVPGPSPGAPPNPG